MRNTNNFYGFVYITLNIINNKVYVGQRKYAGQWKYYLGSGLSFLRAKRKYGSKNFKREILIECFTKEELDLWERFYIKLFDSRNSEIGYNLSDGGGGSCGHIVSENTKSKLRKINLGKKYSEEVGKKRSETLKSLNRKVSKEHRQVLSEALKGNKRRHVDVELINIETKEILNFYTLKEACYFLQISQNTGLRYIKGVRKGYGNSKYELGIVKGYKIQYKNPAFGVSKDN